MTIEVREAVFEDLAAGMVFIRRVGESEAFMKIASSEGSNGFVADMIKFPGNSTFEEFQMNCVNLCSGRLSWEDPDQTVIPINGTFTIA